MLEFTEAEYKAEAYERLQPIVRRIIAGEFPMGKVNLFSKLPQGINYPAEAMCKRIAAGIWQQVLALQGSTPEMKEYNFEINVEPRGNRCTLVFRFNPDDVRKLSRPEDEDKQ